MIKNFNQQNKHCTTPSSQQTFIKLFYRNQMLYNYKSDEKILKILIHRNTLPTDPNKKKIIIYYNRFETSDLVIKNIFLSLGWSFAKNQRCISIQESFRKLCLWK